MKYIALISLILLTSCSKSQVNLYGEIGNGLLSTFELAKNGNNYSGIFFYDNNIETAIKVRGFFENNKLILNEYNDELEITGTFNGTFENSTYNGNWINPDKTSIIPFKYSTTKNSNVNLSTNTEKNDNAYELRINLAYQKWITKKVETGEYWTEDTYNKKAEINRQKNVHWGVDSEEETGQCKYGIPNNLDEPEFLDLNNDGILDCIAYVRWIYCSPGNWSATVASELLIFVSNNNEYEIQENPESIKFGGIFNSINDANELIFDNYEYDEEDARCCPSIQWLTYYEFKNNKFNFLRKTSEKKIVE